FTQRGGDVARGRRGAPSPDALREQGSGGAPRCCGERTGAVWDRPTLDHTRAGWASRCDLHHRGGDRGATSAAKRVGPRQGAHRLHCLLAAPSQDSSRPSPSWEQSFGWSSDGPIPTVGACAHRLGEPDRALLAAAVKAIPEARITILPTTL